MDRRGLLAASAAVALGGCLGGGPRARLAWILLRNDRSERYEVDVTVEDDGETVFSDAYQLPPGDAETTEIRVTDPVDGPGLYVVRATVGGETRRVDTTAAIDGEENCVGVRISLLADGSVEDRISSMGQC